MNKRTLRFRNILIQVAITFSFSTIAYARDLECTKAFTGTTGFPNSNVKVASPRTILSYKNGVSRADLTSMATGSIEVNDQSQLNGLTVAHMTYSVGASLNILTKSTGLSCVWPTDVKALMGYEKMDVYVVSEFRPYTCQHTITTKHEEEHVTINNQSLDRHLPLLRRAINRKIALEYPKRLPAGANPSDFVIKDLSTHVSKYVDQMVLERDARHNHLDSPSSYAYWQSLCKKW
jgi:hypothetical protein